MEPEMRNDVVSVVSSTNAGGQISISQVTWQGKNYQIISLGRQWQTDSGRHILVDSADGTRFELALQMEDLRWYLKRVWGYPFLA